MAKVIKNKEPILQEILDYLASNEYMNYFRLKAYAYTKNKHKWISLLNASRSARITIHQYCENERRKLELPAPYDYVPSVRACKKAEKEYVARKQKKFLREINV